MAYDSSVLGFWAWTHIWGALRGTWHILLSVPKWWHESGRWSSSILGQWLHGALSDLWETSIWSHEWFLLVFVQKEISGDLDLLVLSLILCWFSPLEWQNHSGREKNNCWVNIFLLIIFVNGVETTQEGIFVLFCFEWWNEMKMKMQWHFYVIW